MIVFRRIYEIDGSCATEVSKDRAPFPRMIYRNIKIVDDLLTDGQTGVTRHDDSRVLAQANQRFRQRASDIGQSTGLCKRGDFRGSEKDFQPVHSRDTLT